MRQDRSHLFPLISILLLFSTLSFGQAWSGILAPSRAINWTNAGLPSSFTDKGGVNIETTTNPWTPPSRTQYGSTITPSGSASTDLTNLNTALSSCPDGHYVLLASGTFLIQGTLQMQLHSCTLRGSGPMSTTLAVSGSGIIWMGAGGSNGSCALTSGSNYSTGSTTLTCNGQSGSKPAVNDLAMLAQCDTGFSGNPCTGTSVDNDGLFVCSNQTTCSLSSGGGSSNTETQMMSITSVSNSSGTYTIGITPGLYMPNWAYAQTPVLAWFDTTGTYNAIGVGLEDLTIYATSESNNVALQITNAYASWMKGVRFIGSGVYDPWASINTKNLLIFNNYFFSGYPLGSIFPAAMSMTAAADTLVLNNISASGVPWEGFGENDDLVLAYNYGRDQGTGYTENVYFDHHPYSSFDLFEGNEIGAYDEDDTFGTHDLNTWFRNYAECWDAPYSTYTSGANPRGMEIGPWQRFENYVGNAIGNGGYCNAYQGSSFGDVWLFHTGDSLNSTTAMRWGNVSVVTQSSDTPANSGVRFVAGEVPSNLPSPNTSLSNPIPSTDNLPCSFFLPGYTSTTCTPHSNGGTGLSWWNVCTAWTTFPTLCATSQTQPFPTVGPDVASGPYVNGYAYDAPSYVAWLNLPIDAAYQTSYTITGSTWSGGLETLTVSTLPNMEHLMGPMQLSGVNSVCTTGATLGPNNEVFITGSTSTTVRYALPSNPGVSCTGTMLFPDVRKFDERVYQNDPGGGDAPAPPSGLSAVVQ
jgi:hypothetical protein